jgi:hypothetical protein
MSHYLSDIASRNTGNDSYSLRPSIPLFTATEPGLVQDVADENNLQNSAGHDKVVPQSITPVQPTQVSNLQKPDLTRRTEPQVKDENNKSSYFSKHIERVVLGQENKPVMYQIHNAGNLKIEERPLKSAVESIFERNKIIETTFVDKKVSKIIPEESGQEKQESKKIDNKSNVTRLDDEIIPVKKQTIVPSIKDEQQRINKLPPGKSTVERIVPKLPGTENKMQSQNKFQHSIPKLVIGKIIVEILPPIKPLPPKTITRFAQPPSFSSHSNSNKLSFGLGQL